MNAKQIDRPIILAICGKSATGKTTLANYLDTYLSSLGVPVHKIISVTTRPPREGEKNGLDYYFITVEQFTKIAEDRKFIEHTFFRNWHYGVSSKEIKTGRINVGVFNPKGLETFIRMRDKYFIIPVYLEEKLRVRLQRSKDREGKRKIEHYRRAIADYFAFRKIKYVLKKFFGKAIMLKEYSSTKEQAKYIIERLRSMKVLSTEDKLMDFV